MFHKEGTDTVKLHVSNIFYNRNAFFGCTLLTLPDLLPEIIF